MISFEKIDDLILLIYKPSSSDVEWIEKELVDVDNIVQIKQTFTFEKKDLYELNKDSGIAKFKFGKLIEDYYIVSRNILMSKFDVYFEKNIELDVKYFRYPHGSKTIINNYFKIISDIIDAKDKLFIGGEKADITYEDFVQIIESFPKYYERDLYSKARIYQVLENYFDISTNFSEKLENYRKRTKNTVYNNSLSEFNTYETIKYESILKKMKSMLENVDKYSEKQWQNEITEIITFIFPKYIYCLDEIKFNIKDSNKKSESVDMFLISNNGNIDLLEIKKPNAGNILSNSSDHDNYYANKFLSKAEMQLEKYLYNLNKLGYNAEKLIYEKNKSKFDKYDIKPENIKIINPKGILIIGNNPEDKNRHRDLEVIKKMYSNMIDIITYDDLINMLGNTINAIKRRCNK